MGIIIEWERRDGILVATLTGRIDGSNASEFQKTLEAGIDPGDYALILDFEQVSFISSAGLRVVLILAKRFNEPGKEFRICTLSDPVRGVITMSGFDRIISVHESQTAAIDAVEKTRATRS
ncbi:MAG: STAS domain-containing protein [Truepera sp.]|nr:STAS domain-containing protein [Truepera sp.]